MLPSTSTASNENDAVDGENNENETSIRTISEKRNSGQPLKDIQQDGESTDSPENGQDENDNTRDAQSPIQPVAANPYRRMSRKSQQKDEKEKRKAEVIRFLEVPFVDNHFPKATFTHVPRKFLHLDPYEQKQNETTGSFLSEEEKNCVICHKEEDADGNNELMTCHGQVNGEMEGFERMLARKPFRPCRSRFHEKCIMKYNAGAFFFQYSALLECQGKLLCPLHCCNTCNISHSKQSAYVGDLIECAICLRSFHQASCYPAGAKDFVVIMDINGESVKFEMMICPAHYVPSKSKNKSKAKEQNNKNDAYDGPHIRACLFEFCELGSSNLIECSTCVRSFHATCSEVETIDGNPVPKNQCEFCICNDDIPIKTPVLAKWKNKSFWLAETVDWYKFPQKHRNDPNFERLGYTVVQWLYKEPMKSPEFSIVPVTDIAKLIQSYISLAKSDMRKFWKTTFDDYDGSGLNRCPYVCKKVYSTLKSSKYYNTTAKVFPFEERILCSCTGPERCTTKECIYFVDGFECPLECSKQPGGCKNRKVSMGVINPKIEFLDTKTKGYGVFATDDIAKGEFISEYVGEIIDRAEKNRRLQIVAMSRDFQANHYMMELVKGLTVDAARYGNISRYINHSCDPNCGSFIAKLYMRRDKYRSYYECRNYIESIRDIKKGEEITFSYMMGTEHNLPVCKCGAANCMGSMGKAMQEKKDDSTTKKVVRRDKKSKKPATNRKRKAQNNSQMPPAKRQAPSADSRSPSPSPTPCAPMKKRPERERSSSCPPSLDLDVVVNTRRSSRKPTPKVIKDL